jgi:heme/copper-type cytochrome/quinol oxidase subunit 2
MMKVESSKSRLVLTAASVALVAGLLVGVSAYAMVAPAAPQQATYTIVAYHWGFAIYDEAGIEVPNIAVAQGTQVTLLVVAASALSQELHEEFEERILEAWEDNPDYGGLTHEELHGELETAMAKGQMDHSVAIEAFGVDVTAVHDSAVPAQVTFTADAVGTFNIVCLSQYCGWGHMYMKGTGGVVVT